MNPKMNTCDELLTAIPLNLKDISAEILNIQVKERSNLFPWNGQFSPQFVEALLRQYAYSGARVLDPFCGSGTVLYECGRLGLNATGIEINPSAYLLARTYGLCNLVHENRRKILESLEIKLMFLFGDDLFEINPGERDSLPDFGNRLLSLVGQADPTERCLLETFVILADFYKGTDSARLKKTWLRLRQTIDELPFSVEPIQALMGDGRYPCKKENFDLVITSPPYINVYNYHQQYRASAEALGWKLLEIARTEIGSNRKHRSNRFLTVIQYCLDLAITLENLWNATNSEACLIFVLGRESRVRGISFLNGEIFSQLAVNAIGYKISARQERVFTNRFGQQIFEDIIHLSKHNRSPDAKMSARDVAYRSLSMALEKVMPDDVRRDLVQAIAAINQIQPSAMFNPAICHKETKLRQIYDLSNTTLRETRSNTHERQIAAA